ncbi:MAG: hypothetical protein D3924_00510 [Candidatus Electrothrix sp. AR4]|nr:hypothetical protein [Candidatus Electrothrix sp. AR4]
MTINSFQPLRLRIEGNGPFSKIPYEMDFTDEDGQSCNIFLLMSENGMGRTTVLEIMAALMGQLGKKEIGSYGVEGLDNGELAVQWDILVRLVENNKQRNIVLSLLAGKFSGGSLIPWTEEELQKYEAEAQERVGFKWERSVGLRSLFVSETAQKIQTIFREWEGAAPANFTAFQRIS